MLTDLLHRITLRIAQRFFCVLYCDTQILVRCSQSSEQLNCSNSYTQKTVPLHDAFDFIEGIKKRLPRLTESLNNEVSMLLQDCGDGTKDSSCPVCPD